MTIQDLKDADVIQQAIDKAKNDPMRPLLVINCITYNHAPYLAQCLEGFVMQKTNFPFVALVHDDASLDGTAEILREYAEKYPDIIKPICDPTNRYSDKSLDLIMNEWINAYEPKYIAMCEGDDYWIDSLKLQKQVDFLETNSGYGMCYTNFDIQFQDSGRVIKNVAKTLPSRYPMVYESLKEYIKSKGYVAPMSWVIRSSLIESYEPIQNACDGTYCMFAHYMNASKVHYLKDVTCVYRVLKNSASRSESQVVEYKRRNDLLNLQLILLAKYGYYDEEKEYCINSFYKENILFFAENNMLEEIKLCIGNCQNLTIKDYIILKLGSSFIGSRCLKYIHHQWGRMKGY